MTTELLKGSGGLAADALLRVNAGDGGRSAPTTPQVAALEASETPVEGGGPGQPLFYPAFGVVPPGDRPRSVTYTSPEALKAILEAVVSDAVPIRADPETKPFEREFHCWEDDESRRVEVDANSPRYLAKLVNLYRQGLFLPTQADLYWDREGRPSLVALGGHSRAQVNLRGWQRRLNRHQYGKAKDQ